MFASLAARKFLDKFYPAESTFIDISDYATRIQLDQQKAAASDSQVVLKVPKVEKVPGGCIQLAISLTPEAHPLAEERVATIALLGALDLPRPDSTKDKLAGMIQEVYYVIERGFSRTVSQPQLDCEGSPQFFEKLGVEVFQAAEAALVEFDQENRMLTIKIHRKEPPKPKFEYPQEGKKEKEGEEEEAEEEDDMNDELIAFCEFDLWNLVDIERGNLQVDLLERITRTFDCLTPINAVRVLANECHPSMINPYGRGLIELRNHQDSITEGIRAAAAADAAAAVNVFARNVYLPPEPPEDDSDDAVVAVEDVDKDVVELQSRMFVAKKQLKRSMQSLRQVVGEICSRCVAFDFLTSSVLGGQSQETCGNVIKTY